MSYLLSYAKFYEHYVYGQARDYDNVTYRFDLGEKNLENILRTTYEFMEIDYWRDLKIVNIEARFLINGHFSDVKGLNQEQVYELIHDLFNALINDSEEAKLKFMNRLGSFDNYYSENFVKDDLDYKSHAEMWLIFTVENAGHAKDIESRINEDYEDIANRNIRTQNLVPISDIEQIQEEEEPVLRQQERRHRLRRRVDEELFNLENPFADEAELDAEFRNREFLRMATDLEANSSSRGSGIYNRGRGIMYNNQQLYKKLKAFFKLQPWT